MQSCIAILHCYLVIVWARESRDVTRKCLFATSLVLACELRTWNFDSFTESLWRRAVVSYGSRGSPDRLLVSPECHEVISKEP